MRPGSRRSSPICQRRKAPPQVVSRAVEVYGGLDILVNNVGLARGTTIVDTSDAEWTEALDQTLFPAIRASRLAVPHMRRRGGGAIIMIASIWGRESGGRMTYNAVKAAEISLAKSMAQQLAKDNIRVNSVAPGSISFPGGSWFKREQEDPAGIAEFVDRELPFGRFGRPEEVGSVVAFLASPRASWISGASVPVDGCQSRSHDLRGLGLGLGMRSEPDLGSGPGTVSARPQSPRSTSPQSPCMPDHARADWPEPLRTRNLTHQVKFSGLASEPYRAEALVGPEAR